METIAFVAFDMAKICLLIIIAIEIALRQPAITVKYEGEGKEEARTSRREVNGLFQNPMQDGYRKNTKGQYTPIKPSNNPYSIRPHLGDEEDEV
jgi:hypothetical protein